MNKSRKAAKLHNVILHDNDGNITLPAGLTLSATPGSSDNSSRVTTTAWIRTYVGAQFANLVATAPATLDTLTELAAALGNDPNFATTVATSIGTKVPQARTLTINGISFDLSADRSWTIAAGVSSFNTRTGAITLLSADVTGALGFTPYNATNPSGFITGSALSAYLPLAGGTMTGVLGFSNVTGNKIDFYFSGEDRYGIQVQSDVLRIHSGAQGLASGGIVLGKSTSIAFTEHLRIRNDGVIQATGYLRTAGVISNTVLFNAGTSSVDFGNAFGQGTTNRSVYFRGNTGVSAWWGGVDGNGANIPFGAIDATAGEFTFWRNSGGTGGGAWTNIMTMNASGLTMVNGSFIGNLSGNATNSSQLNGISSTQIFNNMGQNHGTNTDFNSVSGFGVRYLQGGSNGPGTGSTQYYGFTLGLGNEYPVSGSGSYGTQFYWNRTPTGGNPYVSVRFNENGSWGAWSKIFAGYADSAGSLTSMNISQFNNNSGYITSSGSISGNAATATTAARATRANGNFYIDDNYGHSIVGLYNSTILQGVFAMGDAYKLTAGGGAGNLYGIAWSHPNAGGVAGNLNTHGALILENGTFLAAISGSIRARDDMRAPIFYDSNNTGYYLDPNSTSNLVGLTVANTISGNISGNANTSNTDYLMSDRDFPSGTLIQTSINYNNSEGDPFVLEIKGNSYGSGIPMDVQIQGYIYANTIINTGGYSNGFNVTGIRAIRYNGNLCFWFPSQGYWNGYTVKAYTAYGGRQVNKVTSITNSGLPTTDKQVNFNPVISIRSDNIASYSAGNANSISNAVGGAYTWTGINYFQTNNGGQAVNNSNSASLQAYSTGNNSAFMSFHRGGFYAINFGLDNDNVMRIGGWSAGANRWQLDASGNMTVAGDVTAYSDARVKTDIQTITDALTKVNQLRGVSYKRTDSDDTRTKIGVIAQETMKIVPEVVNQDNDGMYNVSYGNLGGLFIEAFKEQTAQIQSQQSEIEELKDLVKQLLAK